MGLRMTFWIAPRRALEELAATTIRDVAKRSGWSLTVRRSADEQLLLAEPGELALWHEPRRGVSLEEMPDTLVGTLTRALAADAAQVIESLVGKPWPGIRRAQHGYKRWWLGALAYEAERQHMRAALRMDFEHLARLGAIAGVGVAWLDGLAKEVIARDPTSGPIFGAPNGQDGLLFVEIDPSRIALLLDWALTVERFTEQPGTPGGGRSDPDEWHAYVVRHVRLLRDAAPGDAILVQMS